MFCGFYPQTGEGGGGGGGANPPKLLFAKGEKGFAQKNIISNPFSSIFSHLKSIWPF